MKYPNPLRLHRAAHWLHRRRVPGLPTLLANLNLFLTRCDIDPAAQIGRNVLFQHGGLGVVLHSKVHIGDNVIIMPHVVLGQSVSADLKVNQLDGIYVKDGVLLGAGAKIIARGRLEIGEGAAVGANAVVTKSVPPGVTVVGIPARPLSRDI